MFVCYAHDDAGVVYPEINWLRDCGVNIWYDEGISPGEEFPERLGEAILGASLLLFYISPRSAHSRHCRDEVYFALDRGTPVLTSHLAAAELPAGLALSTGTTQALMRYQMRGSLYRKKLLAGLASASDSNRPVAADEKSIRAAEKSDRLRRVVVPAAIAATVALAVGLGVGAKQYIDRQNEIRWARDEILPQVRRMLVDEWSDFTEAYALAVRAAEVVPDDPELAEIVESISLRIDIDSEPEGADVSYKAYSSPDAEWVTLGVTPVEDIRVPIGIFRWRFEKEAHETVDAVASTWDLSLSGGDLIVASNVFRKLDRADELPDGMVRVIGAQTPQGYIDDFFIDRFEVTNAQFQEFVDAGGYAERHYWEHEFVDDGEVIDWQDAIAGFVDQTGRPGPSTWIGGYFPDRLGDHPVSGVSWYEAAAYARYTGKELPTQAHWGLARGEYSPMINYPQLGGFGVFAPYSNVGGNGTVAVGSLPGVTAYGAYDLAGNVREWCSNSTNLGKVVRGGSWSDNPYDFAAPVQAPPMLRTPGYGFRTVSYPDRAAIPESVFADVTTNPIKPYDEFEPVSDEIFDVFRNQFAYDASDLNVRPISVDDSSPYWTLERLSVATAYGDDRMIINLFLPENAVPPYQTVIYFPGSATIVADSSEGIADYYETPLFLSFLMKSGRAVAFPVYQGTFERREDHYLPLHQGENTYAYTEFVAQLGKDFRRTIDYLYTRDDIDADRLAYYGMSWGGMLAAIIPAIEDRIKIAIVLAGGVLDVGLPEANQLNYLPRITIPVLMMVGRYDTLLGYENSAKPMFDLLATPDEHKVIKVYPTDHIPPKADYVAEILDWLDRYFGPVAQAEIVAWQSGNPSAQVPAAR